MIKSMTGFGRCEVMEHERKFTVELKSVNHRYLDVNIKMPKKLSFFESAIRALLKEYIHRGKVDVFISYEDYTEENFAVKYNEDVAAAYLKYLKQMSERFGLENDIRTSALSRYPEVFTMEEQSADEKELWVILEKALRDACGQFVESRIEEGKRLAADLSEKLNGMLQYVDYIESHAPAILAEYRRRLEEKVRELLADKQIDEGRIITEVTIYADKICVDEETVRLRSHIEATKAAVEGGGSIGYAVDATKRKMGYGKALLKELARITVERGCGRLEWACLDWNQPSIDFYTKNPLIELLDKNDSDSKNFNGNAFIEYDIFPFLKFRSTLTATYSNINSDLFTRRSYDGGNNSGSQRDTQNSVIMWDNLLTFYKTMGIHDLTAMIGQSLERQSSQFLYAAGSNYPDDDILTNLGSAATRSSINSNSRSSS